MTSAFSFCVGTATGHPKTSAVEPQDGHVTRWPDGRARYYIDSCVDERSFEDLRRRLTKIAE